MTENEFLRYVILLSVRPDQRPTEALIRAHVAHLKELDQQGKYVLGGPFQDYKGGMMIIKAASYEEAKRIAERDPFITEGYETYELRTWELSCAENNHLGMG